MIRILPCVRTCAFTALTATILLLSGCWLQPDFGPDRTRHNPFENKITVDSVAGLTEQWSVPGDRPRAVAFGLVYSHDGTSLFAIDVETGERRWEVPASESETYIGPIIVDDGRLLVSSHLVGDAAVARWHDAMSGEIVGEAADGVAMSLRGSIGLFAPAVSAFGGFDRLMVKNVDTGELHWSGRISGSWLGFTDYALGEEFVYDTNHGLMSTEPGDDNFDEAVRAFPVTGAETNCGPASDPTYICPAWVRDLGVSEEEPVLDPSRDALFVRHGGERLAALDADEGTIRWRAVHANVRVGPVLALADGIAFVGTHNRGVQAFDADGCATPPCTALWSTSAPGWYFSTLVAGSGDDAVVFVVSDWGVGADIDAYPAAGCGSDTCAPIWQGGPAGGSYLHHIVVSHGHLFVATESPDGEGMLTAYGLPG